mgnify:CR=1 FL=1
MSIADDLVKAYNEGYAQGKADMVAELRQCRNELCLRCGEYKMRHMGACDGCRWQEVG